MLRIKINKINEENDQLNKSLKKSKEVCKGLILILHEHGLMNKSRSLFSLIKDVFARKIIG